MVLVATNYRPISVTTSCSRILERTLNRQITRYVQSNGIPTAFQFGFRSGVLSQGVILYFVETLGQGIKNGNLVHAFLELSKAFDSISYGILLKKVKALNFSHSAIQCIEGFLMKRLLQVTVNGLVFDWIVLKQGVPQGTVL